MTAFPAQTPLWQRSFVVHRLPSLQTMPFVALGLEQTPVALLQTPTEWHWSDAMHMTGLLPTQVPDWHVSVCVQALPSLQGAPSTAFGLEQTPLAGSQTPVVWHAAGSGQATAVPEQAPVWHLSPEVQALPSLQMVPFGAFGLVQAPVEVLHTPAEWHASVAVHTTGLAPVHTPDWQVSSCVHAFPSLHTVPLARAGFEHWPLAVSHVPTPVHGPAATHTFTVPDWQTPDWQVSPEVHALLSLHVVPSARAGFEQAPVVGSQVPTEWH